MADDLPPDLPNVKKIRGLNLFGTPWATSACCGRPLPLRSILVLQEYKIVMNQCDINHFFFLSFFLLSFFVFFLPFFFLSQSDLFYLLAVGTESYCSTRSHSTIHTLGRITLDEGSARRKDFYNTQHTGETDIHATVGIRIRNP